MRTNLQDRDDAIEVLGEEEFYAIKDNEQYRDIDIPELYVMLFTDYIDICNMVGEGGVTWSQVESYSRLKQKAFSLYDIEVLVKINVWATSEKNRLQNNFDDDTERKAVEEND